jgi:hypothetical protein
MMPVRKGKDMDQDFSDWLLESEIPSIRYLTLRHLLDRPESDAEVREARATIMTDGPVPAILAGQTASGAWAGENNYYQPKYTSTHWSMTLLAELAADGDDPRLQRGADHMLDVRQGDTLSWMAGSAYGLACFWGNMLRYVAHCGMADDPRAEPIIDYLIRDLQTENCHCTINADLPCAWGAARALWGLAALPAAQRTAEVEAAIQTGLEFLLESSYELIKADYPTPGDISSRWFSLNFPLFYQVDILFVLRVAAELGALDRPGAVAALDWLDEKRQRNGRWRGASPYRSRTYAELGGTAETRRWVSLFAARILKAG